MPENVELKVGNHPLVVGNRNGADEIVKAVIPPFWPPKLLDDFENFAIRNKWIGDPVGDRVNFPDGGSAQAFQNGTVYRRPGEKGFRNLNVVYGAIRDRYYAVGGPMGWLGYPVSNELDFEEGGRVSAFQRGAVYWWSDTGAIDINQVVISYAGLLCFGETDWDQGSDSDEPYVTIGVAAPNWKGEVKVFQSRVYEDVDAKEGRRDSIELYRGSPTNILLHVELREQDEENPAEYRAAVQASLSAAATGGGLALNLIPVAGTVISAIATPALTAVANAAVDPIYDLFDFGPDLIGRDDIVITAKHMILLAARYVDHTVFGVSMKYESKLLSGHGASYKVGLGAWPT